MNAASLKGKVAWITGGGSGIGLAGGLEFASAGAHVVLAAPEGSTQCQEGTVTLG